MGLFSFVQNAGRKITGMFGGSSAPAEANQGAGKSVAENKERANVDFAAQLKAAVEGLGLGVEALAVTYTPHTAVVHGKANTQADRELVVLTIGNHDGVGQVDDQMTVENPEPPAVFHTVASGDTLSKISLAQYGVIHAYDAIFEANKPMLQHPDEIFPGQVLRIPVIDAPVHTVAKGETLGSVAKHWFGNAAKYTEIFEANRDVLSDPNKVEVGQQLRIPVKTPA